MSLNEGFELGQWRVLPDEGRITGPAGEFHLTPRAMAVLVYLAEQAGRVVSRDELNEQLWAPSVVTDHALNQCITELRRRLDDSASNPRFIETVPKRGYRLIAAVEPLEHPEKGKRRSAAFGSKRPDWVRLGVWAAVAVAFLIAAGLWLASPEPEQTTPERSIAVLPFEEIGSEPGLPIRRGLHHDLLTRLSGIEDLRVISNTSVRQYRDTIQPVPEIARELGVAWILEGSIQQIGDEIQLNAQLIDSRDDSHAWARTYRRDLTAENLFAIQADIVDDITASMQARMTATEANRIEAIPTQSTEAYTFYLQAHDYMRRDWLVQEDLEVAIGLLQRAVEADPGFALAHADLSVAHMEMHWHFLERSNARLEQAREALDRAVALDPDHPQVLLAQGIYHYWRYRDFDQAMEYFMQARKSVPNHAELHLYIGAIHRRLGQWDEAIESVERSLALDPRDIRPLVNLTRTHLAMRDYASAFRYLERAEALFPDSEVMHERRLWAELKRSGDIRSQILETRENHPGFFDGDASRWLLLYLAGEFEYIVDNADRFPGEAVDMQRYYYPQSLLIGLSLQALGEPERARAHFETARELLETLREQHPDAPPIRAALGRTYAALGLEQQAIEEGEKAMALLPVAEDARRSPAHELNMARIHAALGNNDQALDTIERLLSIPFDQVSPGMLHADPAWNPLRKEPRFEALLHHTSE